jgi:8-amino-7-oxononanoate synthase
MPMEYPVVPKGKERVRVTFHADNTENDVKRLTNAICEWAQEMLQIEDARGSDRVPKAARRVYSTSMNGNNRNP